jgi:hypothetical protein
MGRILSIELATNDPYGAAARGIESALYFREIDFSRYRPTYAVARAVESHRRSTSGM